MSSEERNRIIDEALSSIYHEQCSSCHASAKDIGTEATLKVCSACHLSAYCSSECQKNDWKHHQHHCHIGNVYATTYMTPHKGDLKLEADRYAQFIDNTASKRRSTVVKTFEGGKLRKKRLRTIVEPKPLRSPFYLTLEERDSLGPFVTIVEEGFLKKIRKADEEWMELQQKSISKFAETNRLIIDTMRKTLIPRIKTDTLFIAMSELKFVLDFYTMKMRVVAHKEISKMEKKAVKQADNEFFVTAGIEMQGKLHDWAMKYISGPIVSKNDFQNTIKENYIDTGIEETIMNGVPEGVLLVAAFHGNYASDAHKLLANKFFDLFKLEGKISEKEYGTARIALMQELKKLEPNPFFDDEDYIYVWNITDDALLDEYEEDMPINMGMDARDAAKKADEEADLKKRKAAYSKARIAADEAAIKANRAEELVKKATKEFESLKANRRKITTAEYNLAKRMVRDVVSKAKIAREYANDLDAKAFVMPVISDRQPTYEEGVASSRREKFSTSVLSDKLPTGADKKKQIKCCGFALKTADAGDPSKPKSAFFTRVMKYFNLKEKIMEDKKVDLDFRHRIVGIIAGGAALTLTGVGLAPKLFVDRKTLTSQFKDLSKSEIGRISSLMDAAASTNSVIGQLTKTGDSLKKLLSITSKTGIAVGEGADNAMFALGMSKEERESLASKGKVVMPLVSKKIGDHQYLAFDKEMKQTDGKSFFYSNFGMYSKWMKQILLAKMDSIKKNPILLKLAANTTTVDDLEKKYSEYTRVDSVDTLGLAGIIPEVLSEEELASKKIDVDRYFKIDNGKLLFQVNTKDRRTGEKKMYNDIKPGDDMKIKTATFFGAGRHRINDESAYFKKLSETSGDDLEQTEKYAVNAAKNVIQSWSDFKPLVAKMEAEAKAKNKAALGKLEDPDLIPEKLKGELVAVSSMSSEDFSKELLVPMEEAMDSLLENQVGDYLAKKALHDQIEKNKKMTEIVKEIEDESESIKLGVVDLNINVHNMMNVALKSGDEWLKFAAKSDNMIRNGSEQIRKTAQEVLMLGKSDDGMLTGILNTVGTPAIKAVESWLAPLIATDSKENVEKIKTQQEKIRKLTEEGTAINNSDIDQKLKHEKQTEIAKKIVELHKINADLLVSGAKSKFWDIITGRKADALGNFFSAQFFNEFLKIMMVGMDVGVYALRKIGGALLDLGRIVGYHLTGWGITSIRDALRIGRETAKEMRDSTTVFYDKNLTHEQGKQRERFASQASGIGSGVITEYAGELEKYAEATAWGTRFVAETMRSSFWTIARTMMSTTIAAVYAKTWTESLNVYVKSIIELFLGQYLKSAWDWEKLGVPLGKIGFGLAATGIFAYHLLFRKSAREYAKKLMTKDDGKEIISKKGILGGIFMTIAPAFFNVYDVGKQALRVITFAANAITTVTLASGMASYLMGPWGLVYPLFFIGFGALYHYTPYLYTKKDEVIEEKRRKTGGDYEKLIEQKTADTAEGFNLLKRISQFSYDTFVQLKGRLYNIIPREITKETLLAAAKELDEEMKKIDDVEERRKDIIKRKEILQASDKESMLKYSQSILAIIMRYIESFRYASELFEIEADAAAFFNYIVAELPKIVEFVKQIEEVKRLNRGEYVSQIEKYILDAFERNYTGRYATKLNPWLHRLVLGAILSGQNALRQSHMKMIQMIKGIKEPKFKNITKTIGAEFEIQLKNVDYNSKSIRKMIEEKIAEWKEMVENRKGLEIGIKEISLFQALEFDKYDIFVTKYVKEVYENNLSIAGKMHIQKWRLHVLNVYESDEDVKIGIGRANIRKKGKRLGRLKTGLVVDSTPVPSRLRRRGGSWEKMIVSTMKGEETYMRMRISKIRSRSKSKLLPVRIMANAITIEELKGVTGRAAEIIMEEFGVVNMRAIKADDPKFEEKKVNILNIIMKKNRQYTIDV